MIRYVLLKMSARAMVSCVFRSKVEQHPKPGRCTEPTEFGAAYLYHMEEYMIGIYIYNYNIYTYIYNMVYRYIYMDITIYTNNYIDAWGYAYPIGISICSNPQPSMYGI